MTETATATLTRWGNSQGVLLPKRICENLGLRPGDKLDIVATEETITIVPLRDRPRRTRCYTIEQLFDCYDGTYAPPADWPAEGNEVDWGEPVGEETW